MYFTNSVGAVARQAGVSEGLVRKYCNLGIVPTLRDTANRRLLPDDAVQIITAALSERMARRGVFHR